MRRSSSKALLCLSILCATLVSKAVTQQKPPNGTIIRRIRAAERSNNFEIEIVTSRQVTPETQVLTGPDRVVIDLPGAVPGAELGPVVVNRGDVKGVRVGLFKSNPPVTRIVLDLKEPHEYKLFSSVNAVIVKVGSRGLAPKPAVIPASAVSICPELASGPRVGALSASLTSPSVPARVSFENKLLSVRANGTTLAGVLLEVRRQTGADITVPLEAERELVVADLGPAPTREVLAALLNGTQYNFILLGYDGDAGGVQRVILSPKPGGVTSVPYVSSSQSNLQLAAMPGGVLCEPRRQSLANSAVSDTSGRAGLTSHQNRCSGRACDMAFFQLRHR